MSEKVKRRKTKDRNIYFNENTGKYDVKYNYKEYDAQSCKNVYRSKWVYGCRTVSEAKHALSELHSSKGVQDKDITLQEIYEAWKKEAEAAGNADATFRNTEQQMNMIYQFLSPETKLKNITDDTYNYLISACRNKGYSQETLHNINACFRKMLRLAYQKKYLKENPLDRMKKHSFKVSLAVDESSPHLIVKDEFIAIDRYFRDHSFTRLGIDRYKKYRLLFNFLYYSGCRIGECLAVTLGDFEFVGYKGNVICPDFDLADHRIFQVKIDKVILDKSNQIVRYDTKNYKNRVIPLPDDFAELFLNYLAYMAKCKKPFTENSDRIFDFTQGNALTMLKKAIKETGIRNHSVHDFRHTFISNMIAQGLSIAEVEAFSGDTQRTIFKRYSHPTEQAKTNLLNAMSNLL